GEDIVPTEAIEVPSSATILVPRIESVGRPLPCLLPLGGRHLRFDRSHNCLNDLILHIEDALQNAIVIRRPQLNRIGSIDEFDAYAHPVAGSAHAAADYIAHSQIARYLLRLNVFALVAKARAARDHAQPANARKPGNHVLRDAIGEVLL